MKRFLVILVLIIAIFFLYGRYIGIATFKVNEYVIENNNIPEEFDGFKIIQFSDILYNSIETSEIKKIVKKINEYEPDIIVYNGDLIDDTYKVKDVDVQTLTSLLSELNANIKKFAVIGDNDLKHIDEYKLIMNDADFTILDNSSQYVFYKNINPIEIIGINNFDNVSSIYLNEDEINPFYRIALIHEPDYIDKMKNENINLVLAGHSLGGLVKIPFVGSFIKKDNAEKYIDEYYKINDNMELYVSNGIGTEEYKFRTFNTPSINLFRLSTKTSE